MTNREGVQWRVWRAEDLTPGDPAVWENPSGTMQSGRLAVFFSLFFPSRFEKRGVECNHRTVRLTDLGFVTLKKKGANKATITRITSTTHCVIILVTFHSINKLGLHFFL